MALGPLLQPVRLVTFHGFCETNSATTMVCRSDRLGIRVVPQRASSPLQPGIQPSLSGILDRAASIVQGNGPPAKRKKRVPAIIPVFGDAHRATIPSIAVSIAATTGQGGVRIERTRSKRSMLQADSCSVFLIGKPRQNTRCHEGNSFVRGPQFISQIHRNIVLIAHRIEN